MQFVHTSPYDKDGMSIGELNLSLLLLKLMSLQEKYLSKRTGQLLLQVVKSLVM
jgi:hypothetical protein